MSLTNAHLGNAAAAVGSTSGGGNKFAPPVSARQRTRTRRLSAPPPPVPAPTSTTLEDLLNHGDPAERFSDLVVVGRGSAGTMVYRATGACLWFEGGRGVVERVNEGGGALGGLYLEKRRRGVLIVV